MTGPLVLPGDPTADLQAATKKYVDDNAGGGGTVTDVVWVGTDPPTEPTTELWWDTDEPSVELELSELDARYVNESQLGVPVAWPSPVNSGITVGSGTVSAFYIQIGKLVHAEFTFTFGTGSAVGAVVLNLPVLATSGNPAIGQVILGDANGPDWAGIAGQGSTGAVNVRYIDGSSNINNISATVPFTWAVGDSIVVVLDYIAA